MLRDVFYYGAKPNAHPREKPAKNLEDARSQCTTEHFWIINEFCDYTNFEWDFDFDFLPDEDVWAESHINVWPSNHQKDSGTWLVSANKSELIIYRNDVPPIKRKSVKVDNWKLLDNIDESKFDYSWHPDPSAPPYIYRWGNKYYPVELMAAIEYHVPGATQIKYMNSIAELLPDWKRWEIPSYIDKTSFDFSWRPDPREPSLIYEFGTQWRTNGGPKYVMDGATRIKYMDGMKAVALANKSDPNWHVLPGFNIEHFDYTWHPDNTAPPYIYVFGNQWYSSDVMPTVEYRVPGATQKKYVTDCWASLGLNLTNWIVPKNLDNNEFDFSWLPDPGSPPYIYQFGTQWQKTGGPRYVVEGATEFKYIDVTVSKRLPDMSKFEVPDNIDPESFDFSWHPDETAPPYIYVFGTQWSNEGGPRYVVEGATEIKYVEDLKAKAIVHLPRWQIPEDIDVQNFDFSWHPNTEDKPYVYQFGTQHQKTGGPRYVADGADENANIKYVEDIKATKLQNKDNFVIVCDSPILDFDYSWHPDDTDPAYIYVFGNQHYDAETMPTIEYHVEGATERKYIPTIKATLAQNKERWVVPADIDDTDFDYSWVPNPNDPPYVYVTGTQHQKTGGPKFIADGADSSSAIKYLEGKIVKKLPNPDKFKTYDGLLIADFDYSWHPDETDPPYIYVFGNNQYGAEIMPTIEYEVEGAMHVKYITNIKATLAQNKERWAIPENIDDTGFDYSWVPNPKNPPYIYVAGTQHQKTGGPRYIVEGAVELSYIPHKVKKLSDKSKFETIADVIIADFDYSWHPDDTDPAYIYQFGNNKYDAQTMPTIQYKVEGALHVKYVNEIIATLAPNKDRWVIPEKIDDTGFDYSWVPDPNDPPYVYIAGTQHQKTGGPRYIADGADETSAIKYIEDMTVRKLADPDKFNVIGDILVEDFDYSWHPDDTDPAYIYQFGNNLYEAEIMPTIEYKVEGAIHVKYINNIKAKLGQNKSRWIIPDNIDDTGFDYSWVPNPTEPPYIYVSGTQWQKTGGPRYVVEDAVEFKYIDMQVKKLPDKSNFEVMGDLLVEDFDYSWHPDDTAPPYIYLFGNQHYPAEVMPTVKYVVEGAQFEKYVPRPLAILGQDKRGWSVPRNLDVTDFDFSWKPHPYDPPYIYRFGTQWQKTGGPTYSVVKATEVKYVEGSKAKALPNPKDPRWKIPENVSSEGFDFSWHPDTTDRPYIYEFGTQWQKTGGPRYIMPGASVVKYIDGTVGKALPDGTYWDIPDGIDIDAFDFSWHPDATDPPAIYQFGTQWQKTGGPRYIAPGVDESDDLKINYVGKEVQVALKLSNKKNWTIPENIDPLSIDYTWHPDDTESPYIYQFGTQWHDRGGPTYTVPGAVHYKYIDDVKGKVLPDKSKWDTLLPVDESKFDFSWVPHPDDPPYIYVFGNQWNPPELEPTMEYIVPGATQYKYVHELKAPVLPDKRRWVILHHIEDDFDFSWRPNPKDPAYIYVFGNQHHPAEVMPTIEYRIEGAIEYKYIQDISATLKANIDNWQIPDNIDVTNFDFSWVPNPNDPPYIYQFGTQWQKTGGPRYITPEATEIKYMDTQKAVRLPSMDNWTVPDNIDQFDYSWHPDDTAPPYVYEFATVWNNRGGPVYTVPGGEFKKYIENVKATTKATRKNWDIPENIDVNDFDFSWVPHPEAPAYIYQFGTLSDDNDGPRYVTPNNNGEVVRLKRVYRTDGYKEEEIVVEVQIPKYVITVTLEDLIYEHPDEIFWAIRDNIDYSNFDFDWRPDIEQARYVHVFGSPESEMTQTYFVSGPMYKQGYTDFNFVESGKKVDEEYLATLFKPSDMFMVDRGNIEAKERFEKLKEKYPNIQKTRFLNSWVDTISRCINRSNTELCWILNSELDYSDFNFNYYPNEWQLKMVHVFGTQWSHWGTTFMVNRDTFAEDTKYIKIVEHLSNLNFVKDRRAVATNNLFDIILIDHGNDIEPVKNQLIRKASGKEINVVKYDTDYYVTLKNIIKSLPNKKEHYVWICSSICDYKDFDFSYITDPFARDNLHVFPSNQQKFGDTFFIDVNITKNVIENIEKLRDYPKVNYNQTVKANRLPAPVIEVNADTHAGILDFDFDFPYVVMQTEEIDVVDHEPICLWDNESKNIMVTTTGASRIIVPREAQDIVKNELYDYPYIKTASKLSKSKPLDIVFLSNGELCADENYEHLLAVTKGLGNRVVRVDGVDGRVQGYHAALEASDTPWAFTVFAKLKVNNKFDWNWQPDRLQIPKHYIFNARNPVNGLVYGHQAMIAYNKKLTLANTGKGLDFTLDDPHESVDLLSGVATFNTDPYSTWRTAFREVIKLKSDYSEIAEERLNAWLQLGEGDFAEDCLQGANDAVEFYDSVMGDIEELKKSYEWAWLKDYYKNKHR